MQIAVRLHIRLSILAALGACVMHAANVEAQPLNGAATPPLSIEALKNATYHSLPDASGQSRTVQLVDGSYTTPGGDWVFGTDLAVQFVDVGARGDLNGDGAEDVVALIQEPQGNNFAAVIAVYLNDAGTPSHVASAVVGSRIGGPTSMRIQSGTIVLNGKWHAQNDGMCCPTQVLTPTFRLESDHLVETDSLVTSDYYHFSTYAFGDGAADADAPATTTADPASAPAASVAAPSAPAAVPAVQPTPLPPPDTSAPAPDAEAGVPDVLTDGTRADILAAVDRANAGWAAATQSLDASSLSSSVAGAELVSDLAELDRLRRLGQTRRNINTAFSVSSVTLDAPGHAVVRTHETWYAETYAAGRATLIQRTAPVTYNESYTVEFLNGSWIVTRNDL